MALFTEAYVREQAKEEVKKTGLIKKAESVILESAATYSESKTFDIFLSHSIRDAELIVGMKKIIEDLGYTVYVDWVEDPQMDRTKVNADTAEKLRQRMNSCKSLFFVTTTNSDSSKWMPWECGYFDGKKEKVAIVPIQVTSTNNNYVGQEYLGLYPFIVKEKSKQNGDVLWVHKSKSHYVAYDNWIKVHRNLLTWNEE